MPRYRMNENLDLALVHQARGQVQVLPEMLVFRTTGGVLHILAVAVKPRKAPTEVGGTDVE